MTILSLAASSSQDGIPSLSGTAFLTVSSDSMKGTFDKGDLILVKKLTEEGKKTLKKDDVITFRADLDNNGTDELNTHRIYEVVYDDNGLVDGYITWGDNNPIKDEDPVSWQLVVGKWNKNTPDDGVAIPFVGGVISFIQKPTGFLVAIVLPLVIFFLYEVYVFIKAVFTVKGEKASKTQAAESAAHDEAVKQAAIAEYLAAQEAAKAAEEAAAREEEIKKRAIEEYLAAQAAAKPADTAQNTENNSSDSEG
jgi:signal peptidase